MTTRSTIYGQFRKAFRSKLLAMLRRLSAVDDFRDIFSDLLHDHAICPGCAEMDGLRGMEPPHYGLGQCLLRGTRYRKDVIFITGRFRSGSTLLWNIFRNVPSATAYYEPLHDRRWFDRASRGNRVDSTHLGVSDYWSEYEGLEVLSNYHDEAWSYRNLYMSGTSWNPRLERYIEILIEAAGGRPVLQFNRVDFRLPWLRARFPNAKILHIYRHPRDQWCSSLRDVRRFPKEMTIRDFPPVDGFYLLEWGRDLRRCFPFLTMDDDTHPYELFYQIWKLSYLFGKRYSDFSIPFEQISDKPQQSIRDILKILSFEDSDDLELHQLVKPVEMDRWAAYADNDWFSAIEARVEDGIEGLLHSVPCSSPLLAQRAGTFHGENLGTEAAQ